jgi:hypothetical protein
MAAATSVWIPTAVTEPATVGGREPARPLVATLPDLMTRTDTRRRAAEVAERRSGRQPAIS